MTSDKVSHHRWLMARRRRPVAPTCAIKFGNMRPGRRPVGPHGEATGGTHSPQILDRGTCAQRQTLPELSLSARTTVPGERPDLSPLSTRYEPLFVCATKPLSRVNPRPPGGPLVFHSPDCTVRLRMTFFH